MTDRFLTLLLVLLFSACGAGRADLSDYCIGVCTPQYAGGFEIVGAPGRQSTIVRVRNPWQGAEGVEADLFIARDGENPPAGFTGQVLRSTPQRVVCMSSSHIAMLDAAGAIGKVVGVSGIDYISNPSIAANRERIGDVGYEGHVDYELLVALDPDLVLLYGLNGASGMEEKLRGLRIPFAYVGDYLEESPLGKAEWILAVGEMVGCRDAAERAYAEIPQRYNALRERVAAAGCKAPAVMLNTPYGDNWFMAPANSYVARLIADAGGDYLFKNNTTTRSLPIDMEEASLLVWQADVWLHVSDMPGLAALKRRLPKFADAGCVQRGAVWNCDRKSTPAGGNDYWESGVIHPDIVLRDLVRIFHPELEPDYEPVYYRQLK